MPFKTILKNLFKRENPTSCLEKTVIIEDKVFEKKGTKTSNQIEKNNIRRAHISKKKNKIRFEDFKIISSEITNRTDLKKLAPYLSGFHSSSEIIKKSLGSGPIMGYEQWQHQINNGEVVFGSVVQSTPSLWLSAEKIGCDYAVFLYIEKGEFKNNPSFLKAINKMIQEFANESVCPPGLSSPMKGLYSNLDNPHSRFDIKLDQTLLNHYNVEFNDVKIKTDTIRIATKGISDIDKKKLPKECFPSDGIVPFIAYGKREEFDSTDYKFVAGEFYAS